MTEPKLSSMLRPAGGGIFVVSTGVAELRSFQQRLYGVHTPEEVEQAWLSSLTETQRKICVLGVPSDTGAGFRRGANHAPMAIRKSWMNQGQSTYLSPSVVDLGDVFCVPHYLSEDMLSNEQRRATQAIMYEGSQRASHWPVTPLGLTEKILQQLYACEHSEDAAKPLVLGGDHSVGWPAFLAAFRQWELTWGERLGVLHFDAHTDLLSTRLGVKYCFATWAYHANELLARSGRLFQIGIRISSKTKRHWESTLNVRQMWSEEAQTISARKAAQQVIEQFERTGVTRLYVSNDIDGTDPKWAPATGTPEPNGLEPDWVSEVTRRVAEHFPLIGADLVEVAPLLAAEDSDGYRMTLETAIQYLEDFCALFES